MAQSFPAVLRERDRELLLTFVVAMVSSLAGLASITNFAQPLEVIIVPTIVNMFTALIVFHAPLLALLALPALAVFSIVAIEEPTAAVFLVSAAGVGTFRVASLLHHKKTLGSSAGFGLRCAYLVFIPNFTSALPIGSGSLTSSYVAAIASIASSLGSAFFAYSLIRAVVPLTMLQNNVYLSSIGLAVVANFAMGSLDGMYALAFAYPAGIRFASPIQNKVHCSRSLGEFWGSRWNVSISHALRRGVFDPFRERFGFSAALASCIAFAASGILHAAQFAAWKRPAHELASVMMFFVLQAPLIFIEKNALARQGKMWVGAGVLREAWTWCALLATAPLLLGPLSKVYNPWGSVDMSS